MAHSLFLLHPLAIISMQSTLRETRADTAANRAGKLAAIAKQVTTKDTARTPVHDKPHARHKDISPAEAVKLVVLYSKHLRPGKKQMHRDDAPPFKNELLQRSVSYKTCLRVSVSSMLVPSPRHSNYFIFFSAITKVVKQYHEAEKENFVGEMMQYPYPKRHNSGRKCKLTCAIARTMHAINLEFSGCITF